MKRVRFTGIAVIWVAAIALAFGGTLAEAGNLKGEFSFVVSDTRADDISLEVTYCSVFGTLTFNGTGNANVVSTDRCVVAGGTPSTTSHASTFTYTVDPDGTVLLTEEQDPSSITHCKLTGSGKILLCDASGRDSSVLQWHAIAVMK